MDKYIRVLLIQLNIKYEKATITTIQTYNKEKQSLSTFYKLTIKRKNKEDKSKFIVSTIDCNSKRQLIEEMAKQTNRGGVDYSQANG